MICEAIRARVRMRENTYLFIRCKGGRIGIWVEPHVGMDELYGESDVVARVYSTCIGEYMHLMRDKYA